MNSAQADERFDTLAAQVHEWVESAVALDEGHFPNELLSDLRDLMDDLKGFLEDDESGSYKRNDITELFVTPEMAEVVERFPRVRRVVESTWGSALMERIQEEGSGLDFGDDDEDE